MLDIKLFREELPKLKKNLARRGVDHKLLDEIAELDAKKRELSRETDDMRADQKIKSMSARGTTEELAELKCKIKEYQDMLETIEKDLNDKLLTVPNLLESDVPSGRDEKENKVLRRWGKPKKLDFEPLDHVELGKKLDLIDVEKSGEVTGARFYYLKNEAVLMQFGIIQLVLETLTDSSIIARLAREVKNPFDTPFTPIIPPVMIKPEVMKKMDRLDPIEERYYIQSDDLVLVGSAEHTLGPLLMDEIVDLKDLPIRYIGYSTAFRREAGSYGKDMKGILRVHQFDKLEIETFTSKEYGRAEQDLIVALQEHLVQQLEIPYQVIAICTGDMGKPDTRQIDIECWVPSQNKYRETHTSDYMTDYQARRLGARYKDEKGEKHFLFMNDATAFAISRALIAILENNQQADGSVVVPKVLQRFVGKEIIEPRKR